MKLKSLLRVGSAPKAGSSTRGVMSTGAPVGGNVVSTSLGMWIEKHEGCYTALPPTHHASADKLFVKLGGCLAPLEGIEFRYKLGEITESEEASIQGPGWASGANGWRITLAAKKYDTLTDGFLTLVDDCVNALHGWLRDPIEVTKAREASQRSRQSWVSKVNKLFMAFLLSGPDISHDAGHLVYAGGRSVNLENLLDLCQLLVDGRMAFARYQYKAVDLLLEGRKPIWVELRACRGTFVVKV